MKNTIESHECTTDLISLYLYEVQHINSGKSLFPEKKPLRVYQSYIHREKPAPVVGAVASAASSSLIPVSPATPSLSS